MAPPSVLLMLALAAPAASVPNFSTAESSSSARLTEAGMASVRSVIRDASTGRLEAAGLASVTAVAQAPSPATPASATVPATGATQSQTESLSEAGRIAVEASLGALRAAAMAMHGKAGASGLATVGNPDEHYARGVAALQSKDSRTAIAELSACVQAAPSRADCRWELGWAYSVEGRWADSLTQWTQVRALNPHQPDLEGALTQARSQAALQAKLAQPVDSTPRPPPPPGAKLRIRAAGDLMLGTTVPEGHLPPEGGGSVIAAVRPLLEDADLTFVNLEGPLCDTGKTTKCRSPANCYAFRSPTSFGDYLKEAGVDVVSTANNHSGDFGEECRRATESTLDTLGIAWSGPPGSVATVERNGLKIGLVAFHTSAGCNHLNNLPTATALVKQTAATHDIVIVSFHGGAEGGKALHVPAGREMFFGEDRGDLRVFTHAVVDAGAHLVLGHGPHVARAMEFYQGRLIAYSLGNFATYGRFNLRGPQGLGMILEVELDSRGGFSNGRILPTKQVGAGITQPDPAANVVSLVRKLTTEDFPDTGARIADDGRLSPRKSPVTASSTTP
ncbi:CapA family protein [Corallococcus coralloides]|uniref:CapA family protein n=1 Tax=Corallococcus coralloides TaxID=184914 RepID=A0A410RIJ0_CORCK|nr:CapA family protein [Corallococcus coralloides]QAT81638.1 CapA family protein [Corallococcus coralloides]